MRCGHLHAAELPNHEICNLAVFLLADSFLLEQNGTGIVNFNRNGDNQHRKCQDDNGNTRQNKVNQSLYNVLIHFAISPAFITFHFQMCILTHQFFWCAF